MYRRTIFDGGVHDGEGERILAIQGHTGPFTLRGGISCIPEGIEDWRGPMTSIAHELPITIAVVRDEKDVPGIVEAFDRHGNTSRAIDEVADTTEGDIALVRFSTLGSSTLAIARGRVELHVGPDMDGTYQDVIPGERATVLPDADRLEAVFSLHDGDPPRWPGDTYVRQLFHGPDIGVALASLGEAQNTPCVIAQIRHQIREG